MTVLLIGGCGTAQAQHFDLFALQAFSGQATLEQSAGMGLGFSMDPFDWLRLGIGLVQTHSSSERDGLSCRRFEPAVAAGCEPDLLAEEVRVRTFRVALHPSVELGARVRTTVGGGLSANELSVSSHGRIENKSGNLHAPPSAHMGAFLSVEIGWTPTPRVPVLIRLSGASHWIHFDGCRDTPYYFAPFCGAGRFSQVEAGLTIPLTAD